MPILACMVIEVRFHLRGSEAPRLHIGLFSSYFNATMFRFYGDRWQPVQCEYADRVEQEHLQRFLSHKMADYVWDATTSTRLEKQVRRRTWHFCRALCIGLVRLEIELGPRGWLLSVSHS